jgi:lysophospholipase L1-like esterase
VTNRPIVFIGDSITDAGRRRDPQQLGGGYVRLVADRLAARGDPRPIINRGISGDRIDDLRERWERDVLDLQPGTLSVYIGINDTWRRYDRNDPTTAEHFESVYRSMLEEARALWQPRMVLVEPYLVPVSEAQEQWGAEDLDEKREVVASLATEFAAAFVPLHTIMTIAAKGEGAASLAVDGVHPTPEGNELIAEAWLAAEGSI